MTPFMPSEQVTKDYCIFSVDTDDCKFMEKSSRGMHTNLTAVITSGEGLSLGVLVKENVKPHILKRH